MTIKKRGKIVEQFNDPNVSLEIQSISTYPLGTKHLVTQYRSLRIIIMGIP